jgi:hypothetical protein
VKQNNKKLLLFRIIDLSKDIVYVPASYILYLSDFCRFLLCTWGWERRGERGGAGEGEGARERGIECILYGYT